MMPDALLKSYHNLAKLILGPLKYTSAQIMTILLNSNFWFDLKNGKRGLINPMAPEDPLKSK